MNKIKEIRNDFLMEQRNHFIRHLHNQGFTLEEIAGLFGKTKQAIYQVIKKVVDLKTIKK